MEVLMTNERMARWLGPLALGWTVSIIIGFFILSTNTPGQNAPAAEVVSYYRAHGTRETWTLYIIGVGLVLLTFYLAGLRTALRDANESHSWLATTAFAGGLVLVSGFALTGMNHFALIEAARNNRTTLAGDLNFVDNITPVPMILGVAVLAAATAAAILTSQALPRWLGAVGLVMAAVCLLGPASFIAFLATPIFLTVLGFVIGTQSMAHAEAGEETPRRTMGHRMTLRHHH
jgi:hypothetical protein